MSRSQQKKGSDGEKELVEILTAHGYPVTWGGSQSYGGTPDVSGLHGIHIEVKRVERLNVPEAMEQSVIDSIKFRDGLPALFHRRNRKPWLVTMRLDDWLVLYRRSGF